MENNKKKLGLMDATFLVAGSMIGSGIFLVSATMSRDLGSSGWLIFTWLLTGVITLFGALSYGELAAMFPKAGGQYVYIREAWGKAPAFLYGWTTFAVIQTGVIAAVGVAFGKFLGVFFPVLVEKPIVDSFVTIRGANFVGAAMVVFLTFLNARGIQYGKIIQTIFTSSKLIAMTVLIVAGIGYGVSSGLLSFNFENAWNATKIFAVEDESGKQFWKTENLAGFGLLIVLSTTIINSLFSSDAWNNVTFIAGDIRNPEKNLPRSLFLGTFIVTILYILSNIAYLSLLPLKGHFIGESFALSTETVQTAGIQFASDGRVGTAAAYVLMGGIGTALMAVLILISTFGCNNGLIMAGSRLFASMSEDGLFFKKAKELNRFGVPAWALWVQCAWTLILCLSGSYDILVKFATFGSMIFYIVTISGIFKLRKTMPDVERPYKAFGYPVIPGLYLLLALAICISLAVFTFNDTIGSVILILIGIPIYLFVSKKNKASN